MAQSLLHKQNTSLQYGELLKNIRKCVPLKISVEEKINLIIREVIKELPVDVCSCYLMRPGDVLELYATMGLNLKAVHETFLRLGEGLIGEIALKRKPQAFENAQEHASYSFKPETNERHFKSLAGAPILYENMLLGVISIQTKQPFIYPPELLNVLQIIALVMADILYLSVTGSAEKKISTGHQHKKIEATRLIPGIALGNAYIHRRAVLNAVLADDVHKEIKKLEAALKTAEDEINHLIMKPDTKSEQSGILETYLMFVHDKGWLQKMKQEIENGLTAEAAVLKVCAEMVRRMELTKDSYIKERIHDFRDLTSRIIRLLHGKQLVSAKKLPRNAILIAESLGPAELLDYDLSRIKGIVLEEGSQTMHVVIVARSYNIPVLSGIKDISALVLNNDVLALDADRGFLYINPADEVLDEFESRLKEQKRLQSRLTQMGALPAVTQDGFSVSLNINAGLETDLMNVRGVTYDGIGLFRTELPFMSSEKLPDVAAQTAIYRRVISEMKDKPVVFRSLDIGSDKILPYFENRNEKNPAMGWRSIRVTLDRRAILRKQLRAFIHAGAGKTLYVMFPMISTVAEFNQARQTLEWELQRERERGCLMPAEIKVGTMLEVPSLLFQLEELVKYVDFISVGTNDLTQFLFATDRSNPLIWSRYDTLSPPFLRMMQFVQRTCEKANVECSVCGEMASHPLEAVALIGLGFKKLSMNPAALGRIKAVIRSMDQKKVHEFLLRYLSDTTATLRPLLQAYVIDHEIFV